MTEENRVNIIRHVLWVVLLGFLLFGALWLVTSYLDPIKPHMEWPYVMGPALLTILFAALLRTLMQFRQDIKSKRREDAPRPSIFSIRSLVALILAAVLLAVAYSGFLAAPNEADLRKSLVFNLVKEVGFALLVGLVIWIVFEFFKQEESEERWNARIDNMQKSVFFGVFRRNFPTDLMSEANLLLLDQHFIRSRFHVLYTLNDETYSKNGESLPCVLLESVQQFKIKNVSADKQSLRIRAGLPNPSVYELKQKCRVRSVQLRREGGTLEKLPIETAQAKFQEAIAKAESGHNVPFELSPITVARDEEVELVWDVVMAKEEEDNEIMTFNYATESLGLTIVDQGSEKRQIGARSIHRQDLVTLSRDPEKGSFTYAVDHFFLPRQGYVLWWKKAAEPRLPDGNTGPKDGLTTPAEP